MAILDITTQNDTLVVDSRLIAEDLGIQHKNLLQTITKYQNVIEQSFGVIAFAALKPPEGSQGGRPEMVCYLSDKQVVCLVNKTRNGISQSFVEKHRQLGFELHDININDRSTTGRQLLKESDYSKRLAKQLNGKREITTIAGNIDVLTTTELIEIKAVKMWKHALGQVLIYGYYYPSHQKRIHLYGETQESFLNMIKSHCNRFNVKVTWEN